MVLQLEACIHPFFDELRDPNTRLPNGRPLPPLFNFKPQGEFNYYLIEYWSSLEELYLKQLANYWHLSHVQLLLIQELELFKWRLINNLFVTCHLISVLRAWSNVIAPPPPPPPPPAHHIGYMCWNFIFIKSMGGKDQMANYLVMEPLISCQE